MPRLRPGFLDEAACLLRFGIVGIANTLLGGGAIAGLQWGCGLDPFPANAGGFAVGIVAGFFLNRSFTFRVKSSSAAMVRYAAAVFVAFCGNLVVLEMAQAHLPAFAGKAIVAQGAAMSAYTAISFLLCRSWVFGAPRRAAGTEMARTV